MKPTTKTAAGSPRKAGANKAPARPPRKAAAPATPPAAAPQVAGDATPDARPVGLLIVHGIGSQKQGSVLVGYGEPLTAHLAAAVGAVGGAVDITDTHLRDAPDGSPCHFRMRIRPGKPAPKSSFEAVVAEAWWADSFPTPNFPTMLGWGVKLLWRPLTRPLGRLWRQRSTWFDGLDHPSVRGWVAFVSTVAATVTTILGLLLLVPVLAVLAVVAVVALAVLAALAKLPAGAPDWAGKVQLALAASVGDAYALQRSPLRSAAMRTSIETDLAWLRRTCRRVVILAHSQGSALTARLLADPVAVPTAVPTVGSGDSGQDKLAEIAGLVTIGTAIDLLRTDDRSLESVVSAVYAQHPQLHWTNLWAGFDPVPEGPLDQPDGAVNWPVQCRVDNDQSPLTDHTTYQRNAEQVLAPLAASLFEAAGEGAAWTALYEASTGAAAGSKVTGLTASGVQVSIDVRRATRGLLLWLARPLWIVAGLIVGMWLQRHFSDTHTAAVNTWLGKVIHAKLKVPDSVDVSGFLHMIDPTLKLAAGFVLAGIVWALTVGVLWREWQSASNARFGIREGRPGPGWRFRVVAVVYAAVTVVGLWLACYHIADPAKASASVGRAAPAGALITHHGVFYAGAAYLALLSAALLLTPELDVKAAAARAGARALVAVAKVPLLKSVVRPSSK